MEETVANELKKKIWKDWPQLKKWP